MRRVLSLVFAMILLAPSTSMAQATPTIAVSLRDIMPPASTFGDDWYSFGGYTPKAADDSEFQAGFGTYFGGPLGGRIQIVIMQNVESRSAQNDAWEGMESWVSSDEYSDEFDIEYSRKSDLEDEPLPPGIADAVRVDGRDYFNSFPMCSGIYAVEPDLMFYVKMRGDIVVLGGDPGVGNDCDQLAAIIAERSGRL